MRLFIVKEKGIDFRTDDIHSSMKYSLLVSTWYAFFKMIAKEFYVWGQHLHNILCDSWSVQTFSICALEILTVTRQLLMPAATT